MLVLLPDISRHSKLTMDMSANYGYGYAKRKSLVVSGILLSQHL